MQIEAQEMTEKREFIREWWRMIPAVQRHLANGFALLYDQIGQRRHAQMGQA
jgi:hypothetical protein